MKTQSFPKEIKLKSVSGALLFKTEEREYETQ